MEVISHQLCPASGDVSVAGAAVAQQLPNNWNCNITKEGNAAWGTSTPFLPPGALEHTTVWSWCSKLELSGMYSYRL